MRNNLADSTVTEHHRQNFTYHQEISEHEPYLQSMSAFLWGLKNRFAVNIMVRSLLFDAVHTQRAVQRAHGHSVDSTAGTQTLGTPPQRRQLLSAERSGNTALGGYCGCSR